MANFKKTQLLTLSLIATLLSFTPLLSSSIRSTYLYFIINVLILVLVAEAGFLSPSSQPSSLKNSLEVDNKSTPINTQPSTNNNARIMWAIDDDEDNNGVKSKERIVEENHVPEKVIFCVKEKIVEENHVAEKVILCVDDVKEMIKKCPSTPSIFFIGGNNNENEADLLAEDKQLHEDEEEKGVYDEEEEELFVKAETFIVNFYKQLKMQREESLKNFNEFINRNGLVS